MSDFSETANQDSQPNARPRLAAIDALRGLAIILMALDHSRDFLGDIRIRPEEIETTTLSLFFTRWVTHLCAPTFVFLSGVSAWLHGQKLDSKFKLTQFLFTRGIWLVLLEFTVVRFGLLFAIDLGPGMFLVIAAIGSSMILLGICSLLPRNAVLAMGVVIVLGHNLLDNVQADQLGAFGAWFTLLLRPGYISSIHTFVGYPILPWFGVMAIGYGLSPMLTSSNPKRHRFALGLGLVLITLFATLRSLDAYGDSQEWAWQTTLAVGEVETENQPTAPTTVRSIDLSRTMFSFLATSKYPPSLLFVLMTLGPALTLLALLDWLGEESRIVSVLRVFGSVPLFFYVLHFYLLHLAAWALYWIFRGVLISPMHIDVLPEMPAEYGFNGPGWLAQVYVGWVILLVLLLPLCKWFRAKKRSSKNWIYSYL
ncbi:MAG: heparan-alpha-glucosaminide N-acetyltransferase domain-containing protein [Planctomycetota bacterium]